MDGAASRRRASRPHQTKVDRASLRLRGRDSKWPAAPTAALGWSASRKRGSRLVTASQQVPGETCFIEPPKGQGHLPKKRAPACAMPRTALRCWRPLCPELGIFLFLKLKSLQERYFPLYLPFRVVKRFFGHPRCCLLNAPTFV